MSRRPPASRAVPSVVGTIRRRSTFRALARPQGRAQRGPVSVTYSRCAPEAVGLPLVGYAIGRRDGNAVVRNRLRRRLRAAVRSAGHELVPGAYLVRVAHGAAEVDFEELRAAVLAAARAAAGTTGPAVAIEAPAPADAPSGEVRGSL